MSRSGGSAGRLPARELQESACRLTECHHPEIVGAFAALLVTVLAVVLAGAALSRLDDAREAIDAERERAREELAAFESFIRRIRGLEPSAPDRPPRLSDGGLPLANRTGEPDELAPVRRAYRETVMAVSHYDTEFAETLEEGFAAEFSPEVAAAVASGGRLTPGLHAAVLQGAANARDRRRRILANLEDEREAVGEARETIAGAVEAAEAIEPERAGPTELVAEADRIDYHERQVQSVLADRQGTIHEVEAERSAWYEYIYGALPAPHPVLSAGTETLERLSATRDEIAARLAEPAGE